MRAQGPTALTFKHIAFTPRAKHVLDFALEEADRSGEQDLGTEHILLGLLREGEGMAARILVNLGADSDELRKEVREARSLDGSKSDTGQSGRAWPPVSDRLTDRALRVMRLADKEAPFGQAIGTEHILLGLVEEWGCVAAKILKNCDVDPHSLRTEINKRISHGPSKGTMGHRTFTSRAERVVQFAQDEATVLGHEYIGTEHLLLGLLREGEGTAAQVLVSLGLDLDDIRAMVLEVVKAGGPRSLGPGPAPSRN